VAEFDVNVPSIARVYDYWLGGKDNFASDRELGDKLLAQYPPTADIVRENKRLMRQGGVPLHYYSADAIAALFSDLELVPPGITEARAWGTDPAALPPIAERIGDMVAAVAAVPAR
jgi:S-adenosyl methyltransferase